MIPLTCHDNQPNMQLVDRSAMRNTFIYAADNRDALLGGLWATPGITHSNFHSMLEIICVFSDTFELRDDNGQFVERDEEQLQPGSYYIATNGSITLTEEVPLPRATSTQSGTRTASFREAVCHRDGGCILTRRPAMLGMWTSLQVTHIFPLAYEGHWNRYGYGNLITILPARESDGSINSVQNGICLSSDMHCFFDNYLVAIDPNENYKIVCFRPQPLFYNLPTRLDPLLHENIGWPPDELLRWHFEQATDFPPGSDMIGEIMSGPKATARMEFELFGRLNATVGYD
ncbi:hypothetical protein HOY82DRAFT_584337 [Tuber indicum]|nr:hypothetical protein HOY82DRAFT_584337 [Tuber indicum]